MTILETETLSSSRHLYQLADRMRAEAENWKPAQIKAELGAAANQIDSAARASLHEGPDYGDSWAYAGELTLRKYIGMRKFIQHCIDPEANPDGYITDACRDSEHLRCDKCGCWCHHE